MRGPCDSVPRMSDANLDDGWEDIERDIAAKDTATMDERTRCETLVLAEIESGRMRGIPETAGAMVVLHRIAAAIRNG